MEELNERQLGLTLQAGAAEVLRPSVRTLHPGQACAVRFVTDSILFIRHTSTFSDYIHISAYFKNSLPDIDLRRALP